MIIEPMNAVCGLKGVDVWYPYATPNRDIKYNQIIDTIFNGNFSYRGSRRTPFGIGRQKYYALLSKFRQRPLLIKDPLASLAAEYFHIRHAAKVIVIIRHPVAFYKSLLRMSWPPSPEHFLMQPELVEDWLSPLISRVSNFGNMVEDTAFTWLCIYTVLHENAKKYGWLVIKHEDLCLNPLREFTKIFEYCGQEISLSIRRQIEKTSTAETVEVRGKSQHKFYRNSAQLAFDWHNKIPEKDQAIIKKITEPISSFYYADK